MAKAESKQHHIEGTFHLFDSAHRGRETPVESGYHPQHKVHDNYQTSARHEYPEVEQVAPGDTVRVYVWFVTPEVYPGSLWIGREIDVSEGSRVVGKLTVTRILNDMLAGSAETYTPVWTRPAGMPAPNPPQSMLSMVLVSALYVLLAGTALVFAIQAYTPCVSNFEGGCSMGKGLLAMASLLPALLAAGLAIGLKSGLASHPRFASYAKSAGFVLCGVPLAYILFTMKALFFG